MEPTGTPPTATTADTDDAPGDAPHDAPHDAPGDRGTDGSADDAPLTLAFLGYAGADTAGRAAEMEDALLALLVERGGRVLFRGRRTGDDAALPAEVHVLWFPSRAAFDGYMADERRIRLRESFGDVFDATTVVEVSPVAPPGTR